MRTPGESRGFCFGGAGEGRLGGVRFTHPGRDVTLGMEHAPDVNVGLAIHIEHEIGIAFQWPEFEAGQIEVMGITTGTASRVTGDLPVGALQGINESQRDCFPGLAQLMVDGLLNIPVGLLAWNDRLDGHAVLRL